MTGGGTLTPILSGCECPPRHPAKFSSVVADKKRALSREFLAGSGANLAKSSVPILHPDPARTPRAS
jgi:hypothetical protein